MQNRSATFAELYRLSNYSCVAGGKLVTGSKRSPMWLFAALCAAIMLISPILLLIASRLVNAFPGEFSVNGRPLPTYLFYFMPGEIWFGMFAVVGGLALLLTRKQSYKLRVGLLFLSLVVTLSVIYCVMHWRP
jgi:hypothetical protein